MGAPLAGPTKPSRRLPRPLIWLFLPFVLIILVLLPVALWNLDKSFLRYGTYGESYQVFELFGFIMGTALLFSAWLLFRKPGNREPHRLIPLALFHLLGFYFLIQIVEHSHRSWDYRFIEEAAQALLAGQNPYFHWHDYPPLMTQVMTTIYQGMAGVCRLSGRSAEPDSLWHVLFYFYQCGQYFMMMAAVLGSYRFTRKAGASRIPAALLVALFFVFNNPAIRTLQFNQVNLWIFNAMLWAFLLLENRPLLSGMLMALGAHIKLYPLLLLGFMAFLRKFKAAGFGLFFLAAMFALQTRGLRDLNQWRQFADLFGHFPRGWYFRDNSIHSLVLNSLQEIVQRLIPLKPGILGPLSLALTVLLSGGAALYVLLRFLRRERRFAAMAGTAPDFVRRSRLFTGFTDTLTLMLLVTPLAWEHHYLFTLPVAIWCVLTQGPRRPLISAFACALIFCLPTFDVFPFSYHRLTGLLILLSLMPPLETVDRLSRWPFHDPASRRTV